MCGLACSGEDLDAVLKQVEEDAKQLMETALSFDEAFAQGVALPESAFCAELGVKLCSDEHIRGERQLATATRSALTQCSACG